MAAEDYDRMYREAQGSGGPPWDIGAPQPALARVIEAGLGGRTVLDVGCGTGDLAIALARHGHEVTAVDYSPVAIEIARSRAARAGVSIHFEVQDATALSLASAPFDCVFDSGLLHSLDRNGGQVDDYLAQLPALTVPGGSVVVLAVSLAAGQGWGLTEDYLRRAFSGQAWTGTTVEPVDVAAETDSEKLSLAGYLLRTVRTAAPS